MKSVLLAGLAGLLLVSTSASAISIGGEVGKEYTHLDAGLGTDSSGLALSGQYTHSDDDGDVAGLGLGFNLPLGPFMATLGGKGLYLNPKDSDEGYAIALGGGLQWDVSDSFGLFGEYYYSPDSLSSSIKNYQEANAGARLNVVGPVNVEAGYRYIGVDGKEGNRDNVIADGPYVGVSAHF